jgi:hypothetical protein
MSTAFGAGMLKPIAQTADKAVKADNVRKVKLKVKMKVTKQPKQDGSAS